MNIYAQLGDRVTVTENSSQNGYEHDKDRVKELLKIGDVYTVEEMEVHSFSSYVRLRGFDGWFNTVMFEDCQSVTNRCFGIHLKPSDA